MRVRLLSAVLLASLSPAVAAAQEKKDGSDPAQNLQSPFQVGSGATLLISQEKTSLTAALTGQLAGNPALNIWQFGLTGTTNDEGKALVYSTADLAAPGFKAKLGFGHSSFLTTPTADYTRQSATFLNEAWCLDVLAEISKTSSKAVPRQKGQGCVAYFKVVEQALKAGAPAEEEAAKTAKAVMGTLSPLVADLTAEKRTAACGAFKNVAKSAFKFCFESGEPQKSAEDQGRVYPELYASIVVAQLPAFYYTIVANYLPALASAPYRDVVGGSADLATKHQWTRLLHGGSIDTAFYYKSLATGLQLGYTETADVRLSSVCKVTTSGDYRAESCKDAMLGKPDPDKAFTFTGVVALDPLVLPTASTIARPGAQLELRYQRPSRGDGHKTEISLPLFLAPIKAPLKLVVGLRPTWTKDTTGDDPDRHFSISFFIGARPGLGS